jgi:hypothetical protein
MLFYKTTIANKEEQHPIHMAMAEANWSELPIELLNLISQQIDNDLDLDLIRFGSVCSTWHRSSISNHHPHSLPFKLNVSKTSPRCSLSKHILLLIKPPPHKHDQETLQPWLIRISKNSHGKTQLFHPLRPHDSKSPYSFPYVLDFNKLSAVHLGNRFVVHNYRKDPTIQQSRKQRLYSKLIGRLPIPYGFGKKVVAVTCPREKPLALGTLSHNGRPILFHCRKECWIRVPCMLKYFQDICVFRKRFFVVNKIGRTIAFGPDYSEQLATGYVDGGEMKFLVESEGELLLVDIYDPHCCWFPGENGLRLNLFRLDEKEKRWVKLTNLGDRVLFFGEWMFVFCFSC